MIGLLCFASFCAVYMGIMINAIQNSQKPGLAYISIITVMINIMLLLGGICGDPGVKKQIYLRYTKDYFKAKLDKKYLTVDEKEMVETVSNDDIDDESSNSSSGEDVEAKGPTMRRYTAKNRDEQLKKISEKQYYRP